MLSVQLRHPLRFCALAALVGLQSACVEPLATEPEWSAIVYGRVTAGGAGIGGVELTLRGDPTGMCSASGATVSLVPVTVVTTDSVGAYRADVGFNSNVDPVEEACIRIDVRSPLQQDTALSVGPLAFSDPPSDSLRIDIELGEP